MNDKGDLDQRGRERSFAIGSEKQSLKPAKGKESDFFGGRKVIILLFVFTVGLSLTFWVYAQFFGWLKGIMGPSTWTFSR